MKKFSTFKIIQLSLLVVLTLASLYFLMKPQVKQFIFSSTAATILFVVVWTVLLSSFIFLLIDFNLNQRDIFQHVPIIFRKPVKPDSMGVPGFSPFGDVHMSFRIPPRLDARE